MFEFILVFVSIFKIVCYFNIFNKCGEKGWKAIIPFVDIWTRFKLFFKTKIFIAYIIFIFILVFSISMFTACGSELINYYDGDPNSVAWINNIPQELMNSTMIFFLLFLISALVIYIFEIILCYYMAKSFKKSNWFVVGLILLNVVFLAILAFFNENVYIGNVNNKGIEGQYNV